ncbi:MAG: zinc ABC transporter substrate-binding protein [Anaerolineae bacterium]|nr:zinc ABC transporter substrate-binding protein [Anaerolineae bacterium]
MAAHAQANKLKVVTTTTILLDIARSVAGDKVDLAALVPPDGDPHEFQPSPNDVKQVADADLIFVNGVGFEGFIDELITDSDSKAKVVTVTDGIAVRPFVEPGRATPANTPADLPGGAIGFAGIYPCNDVKPDQPACDPHLWQDPTNVILYTLNMRDALIAVDAGNAPAYKANAALYIARLRQLDADIWQAIAAIPVNNRVLVTNHDALGYFTARYGFKVVGIVLPGGGTTGEPAPKDVAALVNQIKGQHVKAIFTENIGNDKLAQEIARQTGVTVVQALYTDALGAAGSPGETYLGMMRANVRAIVEALAQA